MDINSIVNALGGMLNQNQTNTNQLNNVANTQTNTPSSTEQNAYMYNNFPPPFEKDAKKVSTFNYNMPIYPQQIQNNTPSNNSSNNLLSSILSNPNTLNLIKQILPLLTNQNSSENMFSNLLANLTKRKVLDNEQNNIEQEFDVDSYIKIDDT